MGAIVLILAIAVVILFAVCLGYRDSAKHAEEQLGTSEGVRESLRVALDIANKQHAELLGRIQVKAQAIKPSQQKVSGAQLRVINDRYNAQVSREQEPRSNSEILKEQDQAIRNAIEDNDALLEQSERNMKWLKQ